MPFNFNINILLLGNLDNNNQNFGKARRFTEVFKNGKILSYELYNENISVIIIN